jgi:pSer/pThr/pTyr-binding forkhead associated (FHA) protein
LSVGTFRTMPHSPLSPHLATPVELRERLEAERSGAPFLVYRDEDGGQRLVALLDRSEVTIGRESDCDVCIDWDPLVSGLHAEIRGAGGRWLLVDDGLSRNGTYLNEHRVVGRKRLRDFDQVRVGSVVLVFRDPSRGRRTSTAIELEAPAPALSPAQRRVLVALCRPFAEGAEFARPATNQEIADELVLSVAAVKTHLRALFPRFGLEHLPHNEKRAALARVALQTGVVSPVDLATPTGSG